ncbi:tRNA (N(6)-L-threonylcarbamoyladenosine(37)-C(2))-methylthiotransferase MtaB [Bacteroidia bacterium]|nr:tRNA (N(6)-L-threonylcarbamoyladenosine(37)-C(2))-methylthiotransferase MtaB [Bacteroidia bacterium]GHV22627.1 tRNA (N(6)-L-threonylcarbamoyladenosine(37)-C(2))-methylthiotransferase MtaB [Bacteroidia bacterium]
MVDSSIFENKKAAYFTLGCKLNFAETSTIGKKLAEQGVRRVMPGEQADICIINTCSVTELADKKCRQAIRRISNQYPEAFVVVTGCYAQLKPQDVAGIKGVDLVLGADQKMDVLKYIEEAQLDKNRHSTVVTPIKDTRKFTPSCSSDDRTRHFLKVQDGCDYYCTYCTIPFARGRSRNGTIDELVKMAADAGRNGGKEIVLTGVNIGDFGKTTGESFFELIKALDEVDTIDRFRISSIEPNLLTDAILEFVAQSKRFAPHFHIPLQSGSDEVLRLMHRKYDTGLFASKINRIKTLMPDAFIGVDVIVGVRGEKEEYFSRSKDFISGLDISQLHVFTYSERSGTQALNIDYVVDPRVKQERSKQLLEISGMKLLDFYRSQQGKIKQALFEHTRRGKKMHGFTENYVKVEVNYEESLINRLIPVTLGDFNADKSALKGMLG